MGLRRFSYAPEQCAQSCPAIEVPRCAEIPRTRHSLHSKSPESIPTVRRARCRGLGCGTNRANGHTPNRFRRPRSQCCAGVRPESVPQNNPKPDIDGVLIDPLHWRRSPHPFLGLHLRNLSDLWMCSKTRHPGSSARRPSDTLHSAIRRGFSQPVDRVAWSSETRFGHLTRRRPDPTLKTEQNLAAYSKGKFRNARRYLRVV